MKKLSFIFTLVLILSGMFGIQTFAMNPCDGANPPDYCGDPPPPPPSPAPLPYISYHNEEFKCVKYDPYGFGPRNLARLSVYTNTNASLASLLVTPSGRIFTTSNPYDGPVYTRGESGTGDHRVSAYGTIIEHAWGSGDSKIYLTLKAPGFKDTVIGKDFSTDSCPWGSANSVEN